jgi:hypothetical protein
MSKLPSQVTVLCEDKTTFHFARRYLQKRGINRRNIHSRTCEPAKESCFDFVIREYKNEVDTYRKIKNRLNLALVVFMDGDGKSNQRLEKLENRVKRQKNEKIAIFIPNRNIETWFEYVRAPETCEEDSDYKQKHKNTKPTQIAQQFKTDVCQSGWQHPLLPSLEAACNELRRLEL